MKIAVYAISKNEEQFVKRFCDAAKEADIIVVGDTGSTDHTVTRLKVHGVEVYPIHVVPWRFDVARDAVLALLPADIDVCVSLDLDEVLQPGWREAIEKVWVPGTTTRLSYWFDWGVGIKFKYTKIHARDGYRWLHPCHEYPIEYGITEVYADAGDLLMVIHKPDPAKDRHSRYLPLLEMSVKEDPNDPRNAFYYARELSYDRQWDASIRECKRYLALPNANWNNERCYAWRTIGRCYEEKKDQNEALKAYLNAAAEAPETREPWFELAKMAYERQQWVDCFTYGMKCVSITNREHIYTVDPEVWKGKIHHYLALAAWHLKLPNISQEHGKKAVEFEPENTQYLDNQKFYTGEWKC